MGRATDRFLSTALLFAIDSFRTKGAGIQTRKPRAGRDGAPSRAILMHSYADRYTHDFFFERDYPDVAVLDRLFEVVRILNRDG